MTKIHVENPNIFAKRRGRSPAPCTTGCTSAPFYGSDQFTDHGMTRELAGTFAERRCRATRAGSCDSWLCQCANPAMSLRCLPSPMVSLGPLGND